MSEAKFNAQKKWGGSLYAGFQIVPDTLIKSQDFLGLNSSELIVLLNLTMHWWIKDRKPFPQTNSIARRMGVTPRTIVRNLDALEKKGLITKLPASKTGNGVQYDLDGLVNVLSELAKSDPRYKPPAQKDTYSDDEIPI